MVNSKNFVQKGVVYVVATPIGNLEDLSPRAQQILAEVDLIAAEDTRHSKPLLKHFNINTPMTSYHEHNEETKALSLLEKIQNGASVAIISDAGTPLISDPGYRIIQLAHEHNIKVVPIPGCCAAIATLSASGLASDKFLFIGFLPAKSNHRILALKEYGAMPYTLIFYESCHRILDCLQDVSILFSNRKMTLARELTKTFETILHGTVQEIFDQVKNDPNQVKGEFVLILEGESKKHDSEKVEIEVEILLKNLLDEMPLKKAVALAVNITQHRKNEIYELALQLNKKMYHSTTAIEFG